MSVSIYLYCAATNECTEALIYTSRPLARIEPNALGAFMAYHWHQKIKGVKGATDFALRDFDHRDLEDSLVWNDESYRNFLKRDPEAATAQAQFENAPSGGIWNLVSPSSK